MQEFRARNETLVNTGGVVFNAIAGRGLQPARSRAACSTSRAPTGSAATTRSTTCCTACSACKVDDALVSDPSGVVRQFLPIVDRPHLERLVEGLEGIQRIHRDIDEYGKLRAMLRGVVEARAQIPRRRAPARRADLAARRVGQRRRRAGARVRPRRRCARRSRSARQAEADEEAAYAEESGVRRELESLQQLHQGEVVQAVARANETLTAAQHEQDRAARELRQAEERLQRSESSVATARQHAPAPSRRARARGSTELRERGAKALGALPEALARRLGAGHRRAGRPAVWPTPPRARGSRPMASSPRLEAHVQRIDRRRRSVTNVAPAAERDARAQHEAAARACNRRVRRSGRAGTA